MGDVNPWEMKAELESLPCVETATTNAIKDLNFGFFRAGIGLAFLIFVGIMMAFCTDTNKLFQINRMYIFYAFAGIGLIFGAALLIQSWLHYNNEMWHINQRSDQASVYHSLLPGKNLGSHYLYRRETEPDHLVLQHLAGFYRGHYGKHGIDPLYILWASVKDGPKSVRLFKAIPWTGRYSFEEVVLPISWRHGKWRFHDDEATFEIYPSEILTHADTFARWPQEMRFVPFLLTRLKEEMETGQTFTSRTSEEGAPSNDSDPDESSASEASAAV